VDGAIPGMVVLGSKRKQAEQAMKTKPGNSTPLWLLYQFLLQGSCPMRVPALTAFDDDDELLYGTVNEINPSIPKLLLVMVFHHSNSNSK